MRLRLPSVRGVWVSFVGWISGWIDTDRPGMTRKNRLTLDVGLCMVVHMTAAATTRQMFGLLKGIENNDRHIAGYRQMLDIAKTNEMQYEVERFGRSIDEYEQDNDYLRTQLIELGYEPS